MQENLNIKGQNTRYIFLTITHMNAIVGEINNNGSEAVFFLLPQQR